MDFCRIIFPGLFFLFPEEVSTGTHSLELHSTAVVQDLKLTQFIVDGWVDGRQIMHFNGSFICEICNSNETGYWTDTFKGRIDDFKYLIKKDNQRLGYYTLQAVCSCQLDNCSMLCAYNGENCNTVEAKWTDENWANRWKELCSHLYRFINRSLDLDPTVSVFQKSSSSPNVTCHATGFFPKELKIFWRKDGKDVQDGVKDGETLPNEDESFQKRSVLNVSNAELQKHNYTCVVQHLNKEIVRDVSQRKILIDVNSAGETPNQGQQIEDGKSGTSNTVIGVVIGLVGISLVGISLLGFCLYKYRTFIKRLLCRTCSAEVSSVI